MDKKVFHFHEGDSKLVHLLGGKGAGLCEMTQIGLPVPPGFIITTEACSEYIKSGKFLEGTIFNQIVAAMEALESKTGRKFGDTKKPLLVSVRSGAPVSMPGMLETILNVGLTKKAIRAFSQGPGRVFADECYRRLESTFKSVTGYDLPQSVEEQLCLAVESVFKSANSEKAKAYRQINKLAEDIGTAVNIQQMVFGNMGNMSGTGVLFTRHPATGEKQLYGEYLPKSQGEELVAGLRNPKPLKIMERRMPGLYNKLVSIANALEEHYTDMQDIEFTVENGRLYILQTRSGKRTAQADVKIAVDMANEGRTSREHAILKMDPAKIRHIRQEGIDPSVKYTPIAKGLSTSPGVVTGKIALTSSSALEMKARGETVILVRDETSPNDIKGISAADGILTARGGTLSHAAVIARSLNKCCITGCGDMRVSRKSISVNGKTFKQGDYITINGSTGEVIQGRVNIVKGEACPELFELLEWAADCRKHKIAALVSSADEIRAAKSYKADNLVYRTEHHFIEERLDLTREYLLGTDRAKREQALERIANYALKDYIFAFDSLGGMPLHIKLVSGTKQFLPGVSELELMLELDKFKQPLNVCADGKIVVGTKVKVIKKYNDLLGLAGACVGMCGEKYLIQWDVPVPGASNCCGFAPGGNAHCIPEEYISPLEAFLSGCKVEGIDAYSGLSGFFVEYCNGDPTKAHVQWDSFPKGKELGVAVSGPHGLHCLPVSLVKVIEGQKESVSEPSDLEQLKAYQETPSLLYAIRKSQLKAIVTAASRFSGLHIIVETPDRDRDLEMNARAVLESGSANKDNPANITFTDSLGFHLCKPDDIYSASIALAQQALREGNYGG